MSETFWCEAEVGRKLDSSPRHEDQAKVVGPSQNLGLSLLEAMSLQALRKEWRTWYKSPPPSGFSRDLLTRAIAYRMQEKSLGGVDSRTRRKIKLLAGKLETEGSIEPTDGGVTLRPGTKLLRAWHGTTYRVSVLIDGFEYDGKTFGSLSEIANRITGAHWSGPRFFGLKKKPGSTPTVESPR